MNCRVKCPFILYEFNDLVEDSLCVGRYYTYEAGYTMMNKTDVIPVLKVVRRYSGLFRYLLEHAKLSPSSRSTNILSKTIILYVFACLTLGSQLNWPIWRSLVLTHQCILDPSLQVFIIPWNLHKTLQLNIWANIHLTSAFQKSTVS